MPADGVFAVGGAWFKRVAALGRGAFGDVFSVREIRGRRVFSVREIRTAFDGSNGSGNDSRSGGTE